MHTPVTKIAYTSSHTSHITVTKIAHFRVYTHIPPFLVQMWYGVYVFVVVPSIPYTPKIQQALPRRS
jgi:hypothetical protein